MSTDKKLAYRRHHTGDRELDEVQRLAQETAKKVNAMGDGGGPFSPGVMVTNTPVSGLGTSVPHNLGRVPTGYIVTRRYTAGGFHVYDNGAPTTTVWPLKSDGGKTIPNYDIWFF